MSRPPSNHIHLKDESSGSGSSQGTCTTSQLGGSAGELRGNGRRGRAAWDDGDASGGRGDTNSSVVSGVGRRVASRVARSVASGRSGAARRDQGGRQRSALDSTGGRHLTTGRVSASWVATSGVAVVVVVAARDELKVGATNAGLVVQVQNKRNTSELKIALLAQPLLCIFGSNKKTYESRVRRRGRRVGVEVAGGEGVAVKSSVLAAQVTSLANLGLAGIAGLVLAVVVGVQVSTGSSAVAIGRNGLSMDVVHERTASRRETIKVNVEPDTLAVLARGTLNVAREVAACLFGQSSNVLGTSGVVGGDGCVALSADNRGCGQEGDN